MSLQFPREFLGQGLTSSGLHLLPKHTAAIGDFPPPTDKPGLQRFLGMISFYRRYLRNPALVLAPLANALKGPRKSLQWSPMLDSAFSTAKLLLAAVTVLTHPVPGAAMSLAVDASDSQVGAVLQQHLRGSWAPLALFSNKLSSTESKYSAFDRELLAAYSSISHFRFLLEARVFTLFTNHKPLTHTLFRSLCIGLSDRCNILPTSLNSPVTSSTFLVLKAPLLNPFPLLSVLALHGLSHWRAGAS